ncbi:MAG: cobalamin-dependent protein [Bacteroidetes bacterium]|nr:cobalamin-dependent protein [Bacteroidota bacterium]
MEKLISLKNAAAFLKVSEYTVKKWTDSGVLFCFRNKAGRRQFLLNDLKEHLIIHSNNPSIPESPVYEPELHNKILKKNYRYLIKYLLKGILKGNAEESYELFFPLYMNNYSLEEIFDYILRESMINIGKKWRKASMGVEQEHIASNAVLNSLYMLNKVVQSKEINTKTAICAGLEDEFHEIGLLCVSTVLKSAGWNVIYPGINLPFGSLINLLKIHKPDLLCISVTYVSDKKSVEKQLNELKEITQKDKIKFLIGGNNKLSSGFRDFKCKNLINFKKQIMKSDLVYSDYH